ncbi:Alkaline phosphatase synthesis sensor protein PhoR [Rubripirellula tenax]|uniref:histidine kinase n=1 Tax=Rubripirellula tenax TaxID=2528015 RepID=A0A5C6FFP2_9BACT|nr:ATP-binding protein [Rubripirellula tenax]TWU60228.1 Alkaline phosphatase synthesis sensor protein PhoR [Rubripirellula tenax]
MIVRSNVERARPGRLASPSRFDCVLAPSSPTPPYDDLTDSAPVSSSFLVAVPAVVGAAVGWASGSVGWTLFAAVTAMALGDRWSKNRAANQSIRIRNAVAAARENADDWQRRWTKLHQEAEQTASALQMMRDGVILLSHCGNILLINPSARRLLAVSRHESLDGRVLTEIVRIPDLARSIQSASAGEGTQKFMVEIGDEETLRPIKVRVDPIDGGPAMQFLVSLRDETETNRVDEMRREFVANISHELKTPLAAIKGYAETVELAIEDDPSAAKHFMSQIHIQCLRLERLIADMMKLARAQAGRSQLSISVIHLADVIDESLRSNRPVAEANGIRLHFDPSQSASVMSDREATLTIVNNLIGNAIRYTSSGGNVNVSIGDAGRFIALVVKDDGVGIPPGEQKRIFERFYRVETSRIARDDGTSALPEGTGIGLSIVKNLVHALRGEVRVSSRPGEGAQFEVLLPKCVEEKSPTHGSSRAKN